MEKTSSLAVRGNPRAIFEAMPGRRDNEEREPGKLPEYRESSAFDAVRGLPPRAFAFAGIAMWCFLIMVISLNLAVAPLHWLSIAAFGVLLPFFLINFANGVMRDHELPPSSSPEDKEGELLAVLGERGELTPTLAAMKTSLTVAEASEMLEGLSRKGYLEMRGEDGILAYSLWERDLRDVRIAEHSEGAGRTIQKSSGARFESGASLEPMNESLSERELEVLTLLSSGKSNREIARALFVAEGTIKTHTNNIYRKLGAKNRAEALAKARALQLI